MTAAVEEKFVIQITDDQISAKYLQKYITLKRIKTTEQVSLAKIFRRAESIRVAWLLRQNGFKAWAMPIS